ncbi:recombinase family protein [Sulfolobus acidocaldarius]|uniref:Resolvase n=4 Tax=Sulfolobus acidocaldarius TaxID=2285 RepID=Q4JB06_SULAC|nr:recombinase family protein [Sulfolobus acidocaldarius]AAY80023.1 resolvase [Sulfolobus acidocaldarius DSM 639]AGE70594.1 resolvase [Sulfolobus acidocaldarius N8]AGE72867.1 resolvase [Sulfolobus acidocaldarius Ron12/I]ALU29053.1 resolvase [Sulfolobus acidocaldarius]ALU31778.1 resolvase [Sulfolobus acidocaldarius]
MKALGYARVSVEDERIENQIAEISAYAKNNGIELMKIFTDVGVSGSKPALEREGFKSLMQASELLDVKTIVIYDLTRLGRDLFDLVTTYKTLLEKGYNVLFVKHPELNVTQSSPIGEALRKALLVLLGAVAELERAFIRERTVSGLARAKAQGVKLGRKPADIPVELVKRYLKMGATKKFIYAKLVEDGFLRYKEKGVERVMSYDWFLKRMKKEGL